MTTPKQKWKWLAAFIGVLITVGVLFAVAGNPCFQYTDGNVTLPGSAISDLSGWTPVRRICQRINAGQTPGGIGTESYLGRDLVVGNSSSTNDYFIPFQDPGRNEIAAFIHSSQAGALQGDVGISAMYALGYTALYVGWIFGLVFIVDSLG